MKIYIPKRAEGYEFCQPQHDDDFEVVNSQINGTVRKDNWTPIPVKIVSGDEGSHLHSSDSPWLGTHALIFSKKVIDAIGPLLCEYGELLPLECADQGLFIFNPLRIIDALDEAGSAITRFENGRIMRISRYAFHRDAVTDVDIFKIPNLRVSPTFVSERFVKIWSSNGLVGLDFNEI